MLRLIAIALLSLCGALAHPYPGSYPSSGPSVSIANGTLLGKSSGGVETFLGIPYAQPPTGPLRLKPPHSITRSYGNLNATNTPLACPQQKLGGFNTTGLPNATLAVLQHLDAPFPGPQGEDCLTLNIQRPAGVSTHKKLPVLFWIYGGGFETGSTQAPYDGASIVSTSVQSKSPVIFVAVNYRVSSFGFMGGKELQRDGSTNLGLRDQRLALQWVAENIAKFGGDPDRVTIWGESAGALSVYSHMVINRGVHTYRGRPLFRGAIMDSGTELSTQPVNSDKAQASYDNMVKLCGCSEAKDTLACLRTVPYEKYLAAQNAQASFWGYAGNNLPFVPRQDPSNDFYALNNVQATEAGRFARVPVIIGNQEDEGTLFAFAQRNLTTTADLVHYLQTFFTMAPKETVTSFVDTYPDDTAAGSPFRTGKDNELYPQFKRLAAMNGDFSFSLTRRHALSKLARVVPAWSYVASYTYGLPFLGTYHTSDIAEAFHLVPNQKVGLEINQFYLNFVNFLNPNGKDGKNTWPAYKPATKQLLNISSTELSTFTDDFRQESYNYFTKNFATFAV